MTYAVDLTQPHDSCIRCGRPTPLGVALCERDNPGHTKGPSATQVHGTILFGVLGGFALLLVLLRLASSGLGPFPSALNAVATRADAGFGGPGAGSRRVRRAVALLWSLGPTAARGPPVRAVASSPRGCPNSATTS